MIQWGLGTYRDPIYSLYLYIVTAAQHLRPKVANVQNAATNGF